MSLLESAHASHGQTYFSWSSLDAMNSTLLQAIVPLVLGVYSSLLGYGIVPANFRDPKKSSAWRARWGKQARIGGPLLAAFGLFQLVRALM
jgi:hypothetical protein